MNITELENDFLNAFAESDVMYLEHIQGYCNVMKIKQTSGVISSLVKKGLISSYICSDTKFEVVELTDKGIPYSNWKTN